MTNQPDWASLQHTYGSAEDIPDLLKKLTSKSRAARERAYELLEVRTQQAGGVYEATPYVLAYVRDLLFQPGYPDRAQEAGHLWGVTLILSEWRESCMEWCPYSGLDFVRRMPVLADPICAAIHEVFRKDSGQFAVLSAEDDLRLQAFAAELRRFFLFTDQANQDAGVEGQNASHPAVRRLSRLYCLNLGLAEPKPRPQPASPSEDPFELLVSCAGLESTARAGRLRDAMSLLPAESDAATATIDGMYGVSLRGMLENQIRQVLLREQTPLWRGLLPIAGTEPEAHGYAEFTLRTLFDDKRAGWRERVSSFWGDYSNVAADPVPVLPNGRESEWKEMMQALRDCDLLWKRPSRLWSLFGLPSTREDLAKVV
jgi:hypothetical protein